MGFLAPTPPPYDPVAWTGLPFAERARLACESWALQGYGTPLGAYLLYVLKIVFYVGMWALFCGFTPGMGGLASIGDWWLSPVAFQKAILWSMLFEGLGLGCGSGPLTGRYFPPVGGFLYWLRPGTTKLPMVAALGVRRNVLDIAVYAAVIGLVVRALIAPAIGSEHLIPIAVIVPIMGIFDRTIFLALRAEHYWTTIVCFVAVENWIGGAKGVQLALWFWAGFSKLNHHFPNVVCVMTSNSPFTRMAWLRKLMYRSYPTDLRPSRLAVFAGHAGTAMEAAGVPLVLAFAPGGWSLTLGILMMLALHGYITSNVPMGVPIEWNLMVVYGGFALFWAHPEISAWHVTLPLGLFLLVMLVGIPLLGNLVPRAISFLMAMRYYAGNWAYGVWLFRGESYRKLEKLTKSAPWIHDQLARFYDRPTSLGLISKVMAFRLMHLHGRALVELLPKAVDRFEDYEYVEGEIVAGLVLGWNFGDGHLHNEGLLDAVQQQCGFEPGELRCVFVEAQPLGWRSLEYRIRDAATGLVTVGTVPVARLRERQPWAL